MKLKEFKMYMDESNGVLCPVASFYNGSNDTVSEVLICYRILTNKSRLGEKKYSYCNIGRGTRECMCLGKIYPGKTRSRDEYQDYIDIDYFISSVDDPDEVIGVQIVKVEAIYNVASIELSGYPKNIRIIRF